VTRTGRPPNYTKEQYALIWQLRKEGNRLCDIAQKTGINPGSIHGLFNRLGGIAPYIEKPHPWKLSMQEREEISRGISQKESIRSIASRLGRPPSTISREINRNGGVGAYRAVKAQERATVNVKRPKPCLLDTNEKLRNHVIEKLNLDWSPEQIAGELKVSYPDDETMRISHETIYKTLYIQSRGALNKELCNHLRTARKYRKSKGDNREKAKQGRIVDAVSISERPPEADDRAVPGHWEGDLILGTIDSQVATLVERTSRFVMLTKTETKEAPAVGKALAEHMRTLPKQLKQSLTWDQGSEMAAHKLFTIDSGIDVYFCDPHSPWQRGSNENTNGLLRQYLPRGKNVANYTQEELDVIAYRLNTRPRKVLDFMTPAAKLKEVLQ
jgi:IS30 family transposase